MLKTFNFFLNTILQNGLLHNTEVLKQLYIQCTICTFTLKILPKTFAHVHFCSKFKFQHFYPLSFECHTYAVNPVIVDLRCVLVKTSLSLLSHMLWRKVFYSVVWQIVRYSLWINQHWFIHNECRTSIRLRNCITSSVKFDRENETAK